MFILSVNNVIQYLADHQLICLPKDECIAERRDHIESKSSKNFSLFVHLSDHHQFLVKQENLSANHQFKGDLQHEWKVYELIHHFSELSKFKSFISDAIHFNDDCAIIVFRYLNAYTDLGAFYEQTHYFPPAIASVLGKTLANLHHATLDRNDYRAFLEDDESFSDDDVPDFGSKLRELTPDLFQDVSADGLAFYRLYKKDRALQGAIAHLSDIYDPCCLTHDDLKFDNVLLHHQWQTLLHGDALSSHQTSTDTPLRIIDWERWAWGDPTHDVGTVVAQFLKLWLHSLTVNRDIDIQLALRLAGTPLEHVQPSLVAFIQSYVAHMPGLLDRFPDFLSRVMKFTGITLIDNIQTRLRHHDPFGNTEVCMFQVAGRLLCHPAPSIQTVFGLTIPQILASPSLTHHTHNSTPNFSASQNNTPFTSPLSPSPSSLYSHSLASPLPHSPTHSLPYRLTLQTLIQHLHIHPDVTFTHPPYPPTKKIDVLREHLDNVSPSLRRALWTRQLRDYIYDIYVSGESRSEAEHEPMAHKPAATLKNNARHGLNTDLYDALQGTNCGTGYFDPDWYVVRTLKSGRVLVEKEGLTLYLNPVKHLRSGDRPQVGQTIAIRLPNHRVESGFYVAISDAGWGLDDAPTIELCLNLTPDGAVQCMDYLTQKLNAIPVPFSLKVLIDADDTLRRDGVILQIERHHYTTLYPFLNSLYKDLSTHLHPTIPLFMKAITPGIGIAEEPETEPHDFGLQRCQMLAEAIITAWEMGDDTPEQRMKQIDDAFAQQGLDLKWPYLNPGSEDIYTELM